MKAKLLLPTLALSTLASIATIGSASAALLAYEGFNYDESTNFGNFGDANSGSGFGSPWYNGGGAASRLVAAGSMSYPASVNYTPTGNKGGITTTGEFFAQTGRNVDGTATLASGTAGVRYLSFLLSSSSITSYNQYGLGQDGGASVTFGLDASSFVLEAPGASKIAFGSATIDTTYLFVAKIVNDGVNSVASVNVYGAGDVVPGTEGSWQTTSASYGSFNINRFYGFQGQNSALTLDEIRLGDTYADVVSVVPEPSALLLGIGGCALVIRRRRRQS